MAATLKVHRSTVYRWRADPAFERELSRRRDEFLEKTFDLQAFASVLAVRKLMELLDSEDEKVALRAAQCHSLWPRHRDGIAQPGTAPSARNMLRNRGRGS
ncbi:MAG: hypothetical protein ACE5JI_19345 [Acidobacteriota bacterium]